MTIWQDLGLQKRPRKAFDMPGTNGPPVDRQYADPTKIGGGVGTEHINGNNASTWTEAPDETARYRGMGEAASKRTAYQADFGKAMGNEAQGLEARGEQNSAANGLRMAAMGGAPSQAAILGSQAAGQSLQAQMQGAANSKGLGAAAAQQHAAQGAAGQQLGATAQFTGMRGNEMQQAQGAYGKAGGAMRAGDAASQAMAQQRGEAQGQSELAQKQLNQQAQIELEQMGINNQQQQSDSDIRNAAVRNQANADAIASHDARNARNMKLATSGMQAMGTIGTSDERAKEKVVPLYEDAGSGVERHWDADVSKAKASPDVTSGASLSGPTPKYSKAQPDKPSMGSTAAKQKTRKLSDAELQRMGDEMLGTTRAQSKAQLEDGPSVGDKGAGWLDRYMMSDNHTKLVAAQREAFRAGLGHANEAADSGKFPEAPAYMKGDEKQGSQVRSQPKNEGGRRAATGSYDKADPAPQRAENAASEAQYDVNDKIARYGSVLGGPGAVLGAGIADAQEDVRQGDRRPSRDASGIGWRDYGEQTLASMSDERGKRAAHPEKDMGAALEQGYKPFEYEYKPGFREQEGQQAGEKNVGPMAQDMAKNSITGNAVERGPDGLLRIDLPKVTKTNSAGIGYLAAKTRKLEEELARMKGGR